MTIKSLTPLALTGPVTIDGVTIDPAGGGGLSWIVKTAAYTLADGEAVAADSTTAPFSLTLPASPTAGKPVYFADAAGTFGTNAVTIVRGAGQTIMGLAEDMVVDTDNMSFALIPIGTDWRIA